MSKVPAHYELIPEILKLRAEFSPETKLLINGDIKTRSAALKLYKKYPELDGFMIGRGVFKNPFCFRKTPDDSPYEPTREELFSLLNFHLDRFDEENKKHEQAGNRPLPLEPLRHFFKIYVKDFEGSKDLRAKMMECKSTAEIRSLLRDYS